MHTRSWYAGHYFQKPVNQDTDINWYEPTPASIADQRACFHSYRGEIANEPSTARAAERVVVGFGQGKRATWSRKALAGSDRLHLQLDANQQGTTTTVAIQTSNRGKQPPKTVHAEQQSNPGTT